MVGGNLLLVAESYANADMYSTIRFLFSDPVIYLRHTAGETLVCSGFERDEAARHGRVPDVRAFDEFGYAALLRTSARPYQAFAALVQTVLERAGVREVTVTNDAPVYIVDHLRAAGIMVHCDPEALLTARISKDEHELAAMETVQRITELAMDAAIGMIAAAKPVGEALVLDGQPLTSERVRAAIDAIFLAAGCVAEGTIVAGGTQSAAPHNAGSGTLRPCQPIVLDIFPRHKELRYYADMTRTVSKGDPGPEIARMYEATRQAQELAISLIAPGADGRAIYEAVCRQYEAAGYGTSLRDGSYPAAGFIHGLGHGLGLEVHERPGMGRSSDLLAEGHVVTVEPGLYDPTIGGVRIEDVVVVTGNGCRNLTRCAKTLIV